jgi:acetyl esterase/lipase
VQLRGRPHSDVLRNEGEAYARRLNEAGVEVVAVRYNGLIHDWGLLNPIATVREVRTAITQVASELRKRLDLGSLYGRNLISGVVTGEE